MKATLLLLLSSICQTSVHSRVSGTMTSSRSQYFEYEKVSLSCELLSSGEWMVWRYTTARLKLSHCGSGWGDQTSSTCVLNTVKLSDSGVYWCESKHRESSNIVNITITSGPVILQSPVLPVMEGHDITLYCRTKTSSNLPAGFYRGDSLIGSGPRGHMTIRRFSKSDEGPYKCNIGKEESPPSWLLMKVDPVLLTASPDSSQLFEYENLSLSCGDNSSFHGWKIIRSASITTAITTTASKLSDCGEEWGTSTSVGCVLQTAKQPDSATYWCESPAGQRSNSVGITVYDTPVILQSPVLPVIEGDEVTLYCRTKTSVDLPAGFYKDGSFISTEPAGHMTIHTVSKSDEGLYKCVVSSDGESPPSWLFVTRLHDGMAADSAPFVLRVICHLVVFCPYCISTVLMVSVYRRRPTGRKQPVSMTTSPPDEDDGLDHPYDEVIADVTTEHHF